MIVWASSGMTRASRSLTPASLRPWARKERFASCVRPDRISLPIIRTQAETTSGAGPASLILFSTLLLPLLHRQTRRAAQPQPPARIAADGLASHLPRIGLAPA